MTPTETTDLREQYARIVQSPLFARSKSLARLLEFLVDALVEGRAGEVKEYTLGAVVFNRGEAFDPATDNIVRVQAGNLRNKLKSYYEGPGAADALVLSLPIGGYVLQAAVRGTAPASEEVVSDTAGSQGKVAAPARTRSWMGAAAILAVLLAGLGALWLWRTRHATAPGETRTHLIAVLPFENLDHNAATDYLADGVSEQTITALARIQGLDVVGRTSTFSLRGAHLDPKQIGERLGATEILEGSVRTTAPGQTRFTARLLDAQTGRAIWSGQFDRQPSNTRLTEDDIAYSIAQSLQLHLVAGAAAAPSPSPSLEAHDQYLLGRYYWNKVDPSLAPTAIHYFEDSIKADAKYSAPYTGLGGIYGLLAVTGAASPLENWPRAEAAVRKAIELNPNDGEAHTLFGGVCAWYRWDYPKADAEYRLAIQLSPGSALAHQYYASYLGAFARYKEADAEMETALRLDPLNPFAIWAKAQLQYWAGKYPESIRTLEDLRQRNSDFLWTYRLEPAVLAEVGQTERAIEMLKDRLRASPEDETSISWLAYCLGKAGRKSEAQQQIGRLEALGRQRFVGAWLRAVAVAGLEQDERTVQWLGKSLDERYLRPPYLLRWPIFKRLRELASFRKLLATAGLPES